MQKQSVHLVITKTAIVLAKCKQNTFIACFHGAMK